jgi:hypothetical protein
MRNNSKYVGAALLCVAFLSATLHAQDKVPLKLALAPGMAWSFEQSQQANTDVKASFQGMTQPFTTTMSSKLSGKLEVLAVTEGQPSKVRIAFGPDCMTEQSMGGQPAQAVPSALAGKTVVVTRNADGTVTNDLQEHVEPAVTDELASAVEQSRAMFPSAPVAVGEEWSADPKALARMLQLKNPDDTARMTLKLLRVQDVAGRPTADVQMNIVVAMRQQDLKVKLTTAGTAKIDVPTGHINQIELRGDTETRGRQQGPGPDGNPVAYDIVGDGTLVIRNSAPFIKANGSDTGDDAAAPPAVAESYNAAPVGTAPMSMAGRYVGEKLTVEMEQVAGTYTGTITMGQQQFPMTATAAGQRLNGSFDANGDKFEFLATVDGNAMTLQTGGATYKLKRPAKNPLGGDGGANPLAPKPNNPLGGEPRSDAATVDVQAAAQEKPAVAAPAPALQTYRFPDDTGMVGLAQGWTTNAASCLDSFSATGPAEQRVSFGLSFAISEPDGQLMRSHAQIAAQSRQMGMQPPPPPQVLVGRYSEPGEAIRMLIPQLSNLSGQRGGPVTQLQSLKVLEEKPATLPDSKSAMVTYDFLMAKSPDAPMRPFRGMAHVTTSRLSADMWTIFLTEIVAPADAFDRELPTMLAMTNSLKVNQEVMARKSQQRMNDSSAAHAQRMADQKARFEAGQAAHKSMTDTFDRQNDAWRADQTTKARRHDDFIETIGGERTIEDTRTGDRAQTDLGHADQTVDRLNESDPGRFRQIPLRDQNNPLEE